MPRFFTMGGVVAWEVKIGRQLGWARSLKLQPDSKNGLEAKGWKLEISNGLLP